MENSQSQKYMISQTHTSHQFITSNNQVSIAKYKILNTYKQDTLHMTRIQHGRGTEGIYFQE